MEWRNKQFQTEKKSFLNFLNYFKECTPSSLPPFLPPLSCSLPVFQWRVWAALRDFNCHIETICIFCHLVLRTANGKSVEFLASQSAQALAWLSASWWGSVACMGLMVWMPQLLFQKHDGPLLVLQMIFTLLVPDTTVTPVITAALFLSLWLFRGKVKKRGLNMFQKECFFRFYFKY